MSKVAFIFPGQGSQAVGMGISVAERFPEARSAFDEASHLLGWDVFQACQQGPEDRLRQTDVAQPALYVTGYAAFLALRSLGVQPDAVAGHSIGEYAALAAAGVFSFIEGLSLVRERGRLMQAAAQAHPGGMAAVLGLSREALQDISARAQTQTQGVCVPVNFNSPEQIVLAGDKSAIEAAISLASAGGAKRVIPLNVSGAFHSSLMKEAAQAMRGTLSKITFKNAVVPVAMNVDGMPRTESAALAEALARQLESPVEWVKSMESLRDRGCTIFVECGSGRVLSGLLRRIDKQLQAYSTETAEAVGQVGDALGAAKKEAL